MADSSYKYTMKMSLNVLNHLGLNLYSNIPAVLSEVVANAYDADATSVEINISDEKITIKDDGHGMTLDEINDQYLFVGYQKRLNGQAITPVYKRAVMGRKGIGKLSLFSIANNIEIHTVKNGEKNGFVLNRFKIEEEIEKSNEYHPVDVDSTSISISEGTHITIKDFKKNITHTETYLRRRLARRFSILGEESSFNVKINGSPIGLEDRDYFKKVQFLWLIGEQEDKFSKNFTFEKVLTLNGSIDGTGYKISGWIGAVEYPSDLLQDTANNNKVSILCRGKMAQEDILKTYNEGGIYADYLIGEIQADFLDNDDLDDLATSSRQSINEDDPRYQSLIKHVYSLLKRIQSVWTGLRKDLNERKSVSKAENLNPAIKDWFDNLSSEASRNYARKLFGTIEDLPFDNDESDKKKKSELYKHGILAFEKLKLRDSLHELDKLTSVDSLMLASIFTDLTDIEANLYYDIASERVAVINQLQKYVDANEKEKVLQQLIFDNLWLLNTSWERATSGSERLETRIDKEFNEVISTLTEEERKGRIDIKYRTAPGKHIIVELKRYKPSYKITPISLYSQVKRYKNALMKCLKTEGTANVPIEILIILGSEVDLDRNEVDPNEAENLLKTIDAHIMYYDQLMCDAEESYKDYMQRQKEVSKLRAIIDRL